MVITNKGENLLLNILAGGGGAKHIGMAPNQPHSDIGQNKKLVVPWPTECQRIGSNLTIYSPALQFVALK